MTASEIRVLVVDDSAFARKVMREVLSAAPGIVVVGIARDGLDALEKIAALRPDVITLDLVMPALDGLGVLHALRAMPPGEAPRVVVVTTSDQDSDMAVAALEAGALDLVRKPTALATDRLYDLRAEAIAKVRAAATVRPPSAVRVSEVPVPLARAATGSVGIVVVGTSTGGPQALHQLLTALPRDLSVPVAIVLHIPAGYTEALARRLDDASAIHVVEASEGLVLRPGLAVIARGGLHLRLERAEVGVVACLGVRPVQTPHRPSVNVLFESAAVAYGARAMGVVLTGMGDDGLAGSRAICAAGGLVLTEAESSCVVYGMPRMVYEAGLSAGEAPLDRMAAEIVRRL